MRGEWFLMDKITEHIFNGKEIPEDKRADFYLI